MGQLFVPMHLIVLAVVFGILAMIVFFLSKVAKGFSARSSYEQTANPAPSIDMSSHKFCSECGKQILRRAEICPSADVEPHSFLLHLWQARRRNFRTCSPRFHSEFFKSNHSKVSAPTIAFRAPESPPKLQSASLRSPSPKGHAPYISLPTHTSQM